METVEELRKRIEAESHRLCKEQLELLGSPGGEVTRVFYPDDPNALCDYLYNGAPILKVYWVGVTVQFYKPETHKGEVQCTKKR
jgi:hypothetical protein